MTDQEVICGFMEPKPTTRRYRREQGWWVMLCREWLPRDLTLDALWEVQERLTGEQWQAYRDALCRIWQQLSGAGDLAQFYLHATAEQKIAALAKVLRPSLDSGEVAE